MKTLIPHFVLMFFILTSCDKKKEIIPIVENKNLVGDMAGHYKYFLQDVYKETRIEIDIYKLSDSTIALKSVYSWNGYPRSPVVSTDSIPHIELTEANKIFFTHQNNEPNIPLKPGGYFLTGNGELMGKELTVKLNYSFAADINVKETAKLQKK